MLLIGRAGVGRMVQEAGILEMFLPILPPGSPNVFGGSGLGRVLAE